MTDQGDEPRIEHRAVDHPKTIRCPHCDRDLELPRDEPWLLHAGQRHAPMLVGVACPHCEREITVANGA